MDKYRLEYEMKSRGITTEKLCEDLNISRSAFYRKRNGQTEFTLSEIQMIMDYLGLETPMGIFFTKEASWKTREWGDNIGKASWIKNWRINN